LALHSSLTDPNIHEPKGASTAADGEVYVADGVGSGAWTARLPTQTGNSGKFLTTDGSTESWGTVSAPTSMASITDGSSATNTVGANAINIASCTQASGLYTVTFTSAYPNNRYIVVPVIVTPVYADQTISTIAKSTGSFTIQFRRATGAAAAVSAFDFIVYPGN
jgi:hypothetical protein